MKMFKVQYLNASTNIVLRSLKKITIIWNVDQKIFKKTQNLESKNKSILHTTVFILWSIIERFSEDDISITSIGLSQARFLIFSLYCKTILLLSPYA